MNVKDTAKQKKLGINFQPYTISDYKQNFAIGGSYFELGGLGHNDNDDYKTRKELYQKR